MGRIEMFSKVKCTKYLSKNKNYKSVYAYDENAFDDMVYLEDGDYYEQDLFELKDKEFTGFIVGTFLIYTKIVLTDAINDYTGKQFLHIEKKEPMRVARVYYGNNKSRLVPLIYIKKI